MTRAADTKRSVIGPLGVFALSFCFLAALADRTGYEGDDLNAVVPMLTLEAARDGLIEIYRYDWQPLSYQIGAALAHLAGTPLPVFLLPALAMSIAFALLFGLLHRRYQVTPLVFFCLLLLSPELFFSGLYYNSVALGYGAAVGAFVLGYRSASPAVSVGVGLLLGLSVLLRLDFVLIIPAMLAMRWIRTGRIDTFVLSGLVAGGIGGLALVTGFIRLPELLSIYAFHSAEMAAMADNGGWNDLAKAFVASTILSPLGFLYYGVGSLWLLVSLPRREVLGGVTVAVLVFPALMALPDILSVKYMLPSYVFLPVLGGRIWSALRVRFGPRPRWPTAALATGTLFLMFAAVDFDNQRPYVQLSVWKTRQIGTHDGDRSWGAYLPQMARVEVLAAPTPEQRAGAALAARVLGGETESVVFIGGENYFDPGGVGWRHAALALAYAGHFGEVVASGLKHFDVNGNHLWLATDEVRVPGAELLTPKTMMVPAEDPDIISDLTDDTAKQ